MNKSLITLLYLLCLGTLLNAQTTIRGRILSSDDNGVTYAHVCSEQYNLGTMSDANGDFVLQGSFSADSVVLLISSLGYNTILQTVYVDDNKSENIIIRLGANVKMLGEVVVTGEMKPISIDSSIYKVKLITAQKIQASGALNLTELLTSEANIRITNDLIVGAQIEMLGMSGQNVKIMIDGVPVIGRLDGNVDLNQINLSNIAQVEVIEGPMSVVYGNNALAGTINLITKKNKYHKLQSSVNTYAESIGRYSGDMALSKKIDNHTLSFDGGYEHFSGVDFDENTRSMDYKPKDVLRTNLSYAWHKELWDVNTKVGYYNDKLFLASDIIDGYKAFDTYYYTQRMDASASFNRKWDNSNTLNVLTSYNYYHRAEQDYYKDLRTLEETREDKEMTQIADQKMIRAIYWHSMLPQILSLQVGTDFNIEGISGPRIDGEQQNIGDYAAFINIKYKPCDGVEVQPGVRYAFNTSYDAPLVYSVNAKWTISDAIMWRASVAKGFRAPSLKELHYDFVDTNHELHGNPTLDAEKSYNFNTAIDFNTQLNQHNIALTGALYYNDVDNMITLVQQGVGATYTYENVDEYKTLGANVEASYNYNSTIGVRAGYSTTGRYNSYTEIGRGVNFNITHDVFAGINVKEPITDIKFNIDYKYNGNIPFLYRDTETQNILEGNQAPYHIMNLSFSRHFMKRKWQLTCGIKNLLDVSSVNRTATDELLVHDSSDGLSVSYGRSYFIGIKYKLYR